MYLLPLSLTNSLSLYGVRDCGFSCAAVWLTPVLKLEVLLDRSWAGHTYGIVSLEIDGTMSQRVEDRTDRRDGGGTHAHIITACPIHR